MAVAKVGRGGDGPGGGGGGAKEDSKDRSPSPSTWWRRLSSSFNVDLGEVRPRWWHAAAAALLLGSFKTTSAMTSQPLFAACRLLLGTLYPAYASYKAVRTKNVREYVKWMMYWIVFAMFSALETFTDIFVAFWFPFYYELKVAMLLWLLSPVSRGSLGSSVLYRRLVHPQLTKREEDIDRWLERLQEQSYNAAIRFGSRALQYVTNLVMQTAIRGGGGLVHQLKKSYSLTDLSLVTQEEEEAAAEAAARRGSRTRAISYNDTAAEEEDEGDSSDYGASVAVGGARMRRNRSVEVPDVEVMSPQQQQQARKRQTQRYGGESAYSSPAALPHLRRPPQPPPPSSGYSSSSSEMFFPVSEGEDMETGDYELYDPRARAIVGNSNRRQQQQQQQQIRRQRQKEPRPPSQPAAAASYYGEEQFQQQPPNPTPAGRRGIKPPPPLQPTWESFSRSSSVSTIGDSYYPSEAETEESELRDEEEDEDTWSDSVQEQQQQQAATITEIYSDEDEEEEDGEKTPVEEDPAPQIRAEEVYSKLNRSSSLDMAKKNEVPMPEVPVRDAVSPTSLSQQRPRSVCTGGGISKMALAPTPRKNRAAPKPPPPPVFRQISTPAATSPAPTKTASRPTSATPASSSSSSSFPPRPPSRGQTLFDLDDDGDSLPSSSFPSAASSREPSVTREQETKTKSSSGKRRSKTPTRPGSRLGGIILRENDDRPASPVLSTSPSRCPHCTIHSWLPHSHNCPRSPSTELYPGATARRSQPTGLHHRPQSLSVSSSFGAAAPASSPNRPRPHQSTPHLGGVALGGSSRRRVRQMRMRRQQQEDSESVSGRLRRPKSSIAFVDVDEEGEEAALWHRSGGDLSSPSAGESSSSPRKMHRTISQGAVATATTTTPTRPARMRQQQQQQQIYARRTSTGASSSSTSSAVHLNSRGSVVGGGRRRQLRRLASSEEFFFVLGGSHANLLDIDDAAHSDISD